MSNSQSRLTNNGTPFKIQHKFRDKCLVPDVAIDPAWFKFTTTNTNVDSWRKAEFITTDGIVVQIEFVATWKDDNPEVEEKIKKLYKHSIAKHKSFYYINNDYSYWHYIKMVKVC